MAVNTENGSVVLIHKGIGIVRYSGAVHWDRTRKYLGIALCDPMGIHDGAYRGYRYFRCKDSHGVFVEPKEVKRHVSSEELLEKICMLNEQLAESKKKIRAHESHMHELEEENLVLKNRVRDLTDLDNTPQLMPLPDVPRASEVKILPLDPTAGGITAEQLLGSDVEGMGNGVNVQEHPEIPSTKAHKAGDMYEEMGQDIGSPMVETQTDEEEKTAHFRGDTMNTAPVTRNGGPKGHRTAPHSASVGGARKGSGVGNTALRQQQHRMHDQSMPMSGRVDVAVRIPNKSRIHIHDDDDLRSLPTTLPDLPETPIRVRNSGVSDYKIQAPVFTEETTATPNDQRKSYVDHWKELGLPEKTFQEGQESPRQRLERFRQSSGKNVVPGSTPMPGGAHRKKGSLPVREMFEDSHRLQEAYAPKHAPHGSHGSHVRHGSRGFQGRHPPPQETESTNETESRRSVSVSTDEGPLPEDDIEEIVDEDNSVSYGNHLAVNDGDMDDLSSFRSFQSGTQSARQARPHIEHFALGGDLSDLPMRAASRSPLPIEKPVGNGVTQLAHTRRISSEKTLQTHRRGGISAGGRGELFDREHEGPRRSQAYGNGRSGRTTVQSKSHDLLFRSDRSVDEPSIGGSESTLSKDELYSKITSSKNPEERARLFHSAIKSQMKKLQAEDQSGMERRLHRFDDPSKTAQSRSAFGYDEADRRRDGIYRDNLKFIDETRDDDAMRSILSDDILSDDAYFEQMHRNQTNYTRNKHRGRRSISEPASPRQEKARYIPPSNLARIPSDEAVNMGQASMSLRLDPHSSSLPTRGESAAWERDGRDWLSQMDQKLEDAMRRFDEARQATLTSMSNAVNARKSFRPRQKRTSISAPGSPRNGGSYQTNLMAFPQLANLQAGQNGPMPRVDNKHNRQGSAHGSALERHMRSAFAANRGSAMVYDDDALDDESPRYEM